MKDEKVKLSNEQQEKKAESKRIKWHAYQNFISFLELEEMREVRRHLIGIEKSLFGKEGEK